MSSGSLAYCAFGREAQKESPLAEVRFGGLQRLLTCDEVLLESGVIDGRMIFDFRSEQYIPRSHKFDLARFSRFNGEIQDLPTAF